MVTHMKLSKTDSSPLPDILNSDHLLENCFVLLLQGLTLLTLSMYYQVMFAPCESHMSAAHGVMQYIKSTLVQGIFFPRSSTLQLKGYCNSDWGACLDTRKSVIGFCLFWGIVSFLGKVKGKMWLHVVQ